MKKFWIKYLGLFLLFIVCLASVNAQEHLPRNYPDCEINLKNKPAYLPNAEAFLQQQLAARRGDSTKINNITSPYYVRVFIRIVRQNDGTLPGCTMEEALQNFNEMNVQYNPHNICFQLVGIDYVNDSYLNNFNNKPDIDQVYPNYIKNNNLDVDAAITIFIHYNFLNNTQNSGTAYDIPNHFISVARWAAQSTMVHSIFGHEIGHCLGLYHTFETYYGAEFIPRNPLNSCYNCDEKGDFCCDTPADYPDSEDYTSPTTCINSGALEDPCSNIRYDPSIINIMSYQPWSCISFTGTALTPNQRTRMHATILNTSKPIFTRVSENIYVAPAITNSSTIVRVYGAKNTVSTSNHFITHMGAAKAYYVSGGSITFEPGVTLAPNSSGIIQASISGCN